MYEMFLCCKFYSLVMNLGKSWIVSSSPMVVFSMDLLT